MTKLWFGLVLIVVMSCPIQAESLLSGFASPSWQRILHMREGLSRIRSELFFLTPKPTAESEWGALLTSDPAVIACHYPARLLVYQRLTGKSWSTPPCLDFLEWKKDLNFHSLSLVYSTGHAGNPASVLGHTFLKLNREDPAKTQDSGLSLLDYGFGFQATTDPADGMGTYVWKGLTGRYPGYFLLQPYYDLVNNYAYAENRDLWEIDIPLSPDEKDLFLAHVWELIHLASADYYFTHVNCSTMMVEVLEAVKPDWDLRDQLEFFALPQSVMQEAASRTEKPQERFWPSQRRIMNARWDQLPTPQRRILAELSEQSHRLATLDDPAVLDILLDRINLRKASLDKEGQSQLRAEENRLLVARSQLPSLITPWPKAADAGNNPLWAHAVHKFEISAGREASNPQLGLRLRYGLHDLLDDPRGYNPYFHLNFMDLTLRQTEGQEKPNYQLEVIDQLSLNPTSALDTAISWGTTAGIHDGQPHAQGSLGFSWELAANRSLVYALPTAAISAADTHAALRLGWYQALQSHWRQLLELSPRYDGSLRWDWSLEQRWSFGARWQLQGLIAREAQLRVMGGVGQYF